jgi:hypothetical protein
MPGNLLRQSHSVGGLRRGDLWLMGPDSAARKKGKDGYSIAVEKLDRQILRLADWNAILQDHRMCADTHAIQQCAAPFGRIAQRVKQLPHAASPGEMDLFFFGAEELAEMNQEFHLHSNACGIRFREGIL